MCWQTKAIARCKKLAIAFISITSKLSAQFFGAFSFSIYRHGIRNEVTFKLGRYKLRV